MVSELFEIVVPNSSPEISGLICLKEEFTEKFFEFYFLIWINSYSIKIWKLIYNADKSMSKKI